MNAPSRWFRSASTPPARSSLPRRRNRLPLAAVALPLAGCLGHTVLPAPGASLPAPVHLPLGAEASDHGPADGVGVGAVRCAGLTRPGSRPSPAASDGVAGPAPPASVLDYPRRAVAPELLPVARFGLARHRAYLFRLSSSGDNRQRDRMVTGRYFEGRATGGRRLVILLPIYGSSSYPPQRVARRLLAEDRRGSTDVLLLDGREDLFDWGAMAAAATPAAFWQAVDRSVEAFRTVAVDVRRLVDWAETRPGIDRRRIGLVGFSVGALLTAVVRGAEPRLDAAVLVMGGGHLHQVFATCYGDPIEVTRAARVRFGWSEAVLAAELARRLAPIEPVRHAAGADPASVLVVEAGADDCIPAPGRDALWRALARPERHTIGSSHRRSFLSMTFLGGHAVTRRITEFLGERL
jgi:dienelactone hydrolase